MPEVNSWIGVVAIGIAGLFAWLSKRDSTRMNVELALVKAEQEVCKRENEDCHKNHTDAKSLLESTRRELAARDERHKSELQAQLRSQQLQITRLRKAAGLKPHDDGSGNHDKLPKGDCDTDH